MKRNVLFVIIGVLCFSFSSFAYDFSATDVNGNTIYYNRLGGDSVEVTYQKNLSYASYSGEIVLPETVSDGTNVYRVTNIGFSCFGGCTGLTSITIPNSVTNIEESAFEGCYNLNAVYISDLESWMSVNFSNITANPLYYAENLYINGEVIINLVIPSNTTQIGQYVFCGCNCTSVTIPNSVRSIGNSAFRGCFALTSITIPNSVRSIGNSAFRGCFALTSITIPNSVTSIGDYAFGGCSSLPMEGNIRYADTYLVEAVDKSLSTYIIKDGTKWIGPEAFKGCSSLTSITIPNSVISISDYAFYGCSSLPMEGNIRYADTYLVEAVDKSLSTHIIKDGTKWIGPEAFKGCSGLISITIPNSVTSIGYAAFYGCTGLTSITIPNGVKSIGRGAFIDCVCLKAVHIQDIVSWCSINFDYNDGDTISPWSCIHDMYIGEDKVKNLILPESVTFVPAYCFSKSSIKSLDLSAAIDTIGQFAFLHSQLETVICRAMIPPALADGLFAREQTATLLVPQTALAAYKAIAGYTYSFAEIKGFSDVTDITDTSAIIKWLPDTAVTQYTVKIYQEETLFAQYIVDGNGQIVSSQQSAPAIHKMPQDTTISGTDYYIIRLSGLSASTQYTYTIQGFRSVPDMSPEAAPGAMIREKVYYEEGNFQTLTPTALPEIEAAMNINAKRKVFLINGQIVIVHNGKVYDVIGRRIVTHP